MNLGTWMWHMRMSLLLALLVEGNIERHWAYTNYERDTEHTISFE